MNMRIACFNTWPKETAPRLPFVMENPGDEGLDAIKEVSASASARSKAT